MANYKNRREQRKITEAMNNLLLPLLPFLNSETAIVVKRALYLLGEIKIEPQEISYTVEQELNEYTGNIEIIEKKY